MKSASLHVLPDEVRLYISSGEMLSKSGSSVVLFTAFQELSFFFALSPLSVRRLLLYYAGLDVFSPNIHFFGPIFFL